MLLINLLELFFSQARPPGKASGPWNVRDQGLFCFCEPGEPAARGLAHLLHYNAGGG